MPTEAAAVAALARVQALHRDDGTGWCPEEPFIRWPCPTARAIDDTTAAPSPVRALHAVPALKEERTEEALPSRGAGARRCPECGDSLADYPDDELVYWRQDPRPFCSGECVIDHDARGGGRP